MTARGALHRTPPRLHPHSSHSSHPPHPYLSRRNTMATLLHIDSSVFTGSASASRVVTDAFRKAWQEQHPEGTVVYRDLAAEPVPHISADAHTAGFADPATHTPGQSAA